MSAKAKFATKGFISPGAAYGPSLHGFCGPKDSASDPVASPNATRYSIAFGRRALMPFRAGTVLASPRSLPKKA